MIDIIDPDRKNDSEEYDMFDEETEEIAGLLQSRAKKKSKTMTTESVRRLLLLYLIACVYISKFKNCSHFFQTQFPMAVNSV